MRKVLKTIFGIIAAIVIVCVLFFAFFVVLLSITEYKPADKEAVVISGTADGTVKPGDTITCMTWNIGYGALGEGADFFMDGGSHVYTDDSDTVNSNLQDMADFIHGIDPDILFLQEVDIASSRSYHIDEMTYMGDALPHMQNSHAENFKVIYLPYPIPTIGQVDAGIQTFSSYELTSSIRLSLHNPHQWPFKLGNLKRCLLVSRTPIEGTDSELVMVNLHLEAYDNGEGKIAQTRELAELLMDEVEKGNYVIAGGDFNQVFSDVDTSMYPVHDGLWQPGAIDVTQFGDGLSFHTDNSTPSCRSLDQPYKGADISSFQYYLIDGFIVSSNLEVLSCKTQDLSFKSSDHNPIVMELRLH